MDMDEMAYVFCMGKLTTTLNVQQEADESLDGWASFPTVCKWKPGQVLALLLHDDLSCISSLALAPEEIPAACVDEKVQCRLCCFKIRQKALRQHVAIHILEGKVSRVTKSSVFCENRPSSQVQDVLIDS